MKGIGASTAMRPSQFHIVGSCIPEASPPSNNVRRVQCCLYKSASGCLQTWQLMSCLLTKHDVNLLAARCWLCPPHRRASASAAPAATARPPGT